MIPAEDYFYDTEFIEDSHRAPIDLISIGAKRGRDGAIYYAVSTEFDMYRAWFKKSPNGEYWLRDNVIKKLPLIMRTPTEVWLDGDGTPMLDTSHPAVKSRHQIRADLTEFFELGIQLKRRLWAWYADYDHVVLSQLWGSMIQLPEGMPMFTHDLKQVVDMAGNPAMPKQAEGAHNALHDAEHLYQMFVHCKNLGLLDKLPTALPMTVKPRPIRDNPQA